jgi:hypothetical protein
MLRDTTIQKDRIIKYLLIGIIICIAARYIPNNPINNKEILMIGASGSIAYALIDMLSPSIKLGDNLQKT